ncbi:MAG: tRNA (adenosine(37)-N6)-threonylcarbamoyltransferase complex ATPase subunit type 1 TsaE [Clostridiales bacterium]|jgi:tRNA threonylcarbamoyladenosine biosynthesis protein TsaE|nr:tRNA (adenosine(37)-N6)-threonylcarbamoyltransferase complex ATPase subunit type 1 TsaE [Clostridiales bacterium]
MEFISNSPRETFDWARSLAAGAKAGDILCLTGDLGCGKTAFAKGFGAGLGVSAEITSPTFTILNIYDSPNQSLPLYHFDVYRISDPTEMEDTGYEDFFYGNGVCLIEWAEIIKNMIPETAGWVTIEKDLRESGDYRKIIYNGGRM